MISLVESLASGLEQQVAALDDSTQPAWLPALRRQGLTQFRAQGLPSKRSERWKYTSLQPLEARDPVLAGASGDLQPDIFAPPLAPEGIRVM